MTCRLREGAPAEAGCSGRRRSPALPPPSAPRRLWPTGSTGAWTDAKTAGTVGSERRGRGFDLEKPESRTGASASLRSSNVQSVDGALLAIFIGAAPATCVAGVRLPTSTDELDDHFGLGKGAHHSKGHGRESEKDAT